MVSIPSREDPRVFVCEETITFGDTNAEGTVSHNAYDRMLGKARERFGLEKIPNFREAVAARAFLLVTCTTHYDIHFSPTFGDKVTILVWVAEHGPASFILKAAFLVGDKTCADGYHRIAYARGDGNLEPLPDQLKQLLAHLCIKD